MVICAYFLNNTCRFGTKCHNEHVNVKLTLKTDAESTLKGNQWPLSGYGPFRDKPCIPNFIEDQSFEEVRHLCKFFLMHCVLLIMTIAYFIIHNKYVFPSLIGYEAKATGNIQMVVSVR